MTKTTNLSNGTNVMLPHHDTHIAKWVVQSGRLDHDQWLLPKLLPYLGRSVWDIGAYIGDHTVFYANNAQFVTAFEPNPIAYECLSFNLARYHNTTCINAALSDRNGMVGIVIAPNLGASHVTERTQNIPCLPADSIDAVDPSFIKIDAEGFEPRILRGAELTIRTHKPTMLIEINKGALSRYEHSTDDIYALLLSWGYEYRNINDGDHLNHEQFDLLCLPR